MKLVGVSITANPSGFKAGMVESAASARTMASSVQKSAGEASKSMDQMAASAKRLAQAERIAADAAGQVRVAESKLEQVRAKDKVTVAAKVKAEEDLYRSTRKLAAAQRELSAAAESSNRAMTGSASKGGLFSAITASSGDIDRVSSSMLRFGAVGAAGLALAGKAAMDWQSAWAGVTKTVSGSTAEMAQLETQLRDMAKTMPESHTQIAAVAEAAGQLGVKTKDVASFTKVMVQLGDTTNLTSTEAASSLAQFMNIMGTAGPQVDRLGATIVSLGNNGASTEKDIVQMGLRIAGAGKQVGLSETQVLAYANALASVGVEAEAGGTAISQSFISIDSSVRAGGKSLDILAKTSGMTSAQFRTAWQTNAAGAMDSFIVGLGKAQKAGGDTNKTLSDLGISGLRQSDALRRLASSGDLLTQSLKQGDAAWKSNSALVQEAAKRYATAESQAKIAWNTIQDSAISAGQALLPVIATIASSIASVADAFGSLPKPVQTAGLAFLAIVTAAALVGGGVLKAVTGIAALKTAIMTLSSTAKGAAVSMKVFQASIPVVGLLLTAASIAFGIFATRSQESKANVETLQQAMESMTGSINRQTVALNENVRGATVKALQDKGALDAAQKLGLGVDLVTDAALGNADAWAQVKAKMQDTLQNGTGPQIQAVGVFGRAINVQTDATGKAIAKENQRRDAMSQSTTATDELAGVTKALADAHADLVTKEQAVVTETQAMIDKFTILRDGALGVERANEAWQQALDGVTASVKQNGHSLSSHSAQGVANRASITGMITALNDKVAADVKASGSTKGVTSKIAEGRAEIIKAAAAAGLNKAEVKKMIDQMVLTPKELATVVKTPGMAKALADYDAAKRKRDALKDKTVDLTIKFHVNAVKAAAEFFSSVPGSQASGFAQLPRAGSAHGGILPGHTPLARGDDIAFPMAHGGIQPLRGGEGIYVTEAMDSPYERRRLHAVNQAALRGEPLDKFQPGRAGGGTVSRVLELGVQSSGLATLPDLGTLAQKVGSQLGHQLTPWLNKALGALTAGGGYAHALSYARKNVGHPYQFGTLWDCSGFMSALHSIIKGESPHRRYVTTDFHGDSAMGFTRGKRSPFMVGVRPLAGKLGHMAGTLNGVNVEEAGGVGLRIGKSARGWNNPMFSWRGGLAGGGMVGDLPYDTLDPNGQHYDPAIADLIKQLKVGRYDAGGMLQPGLTLAHNATGKPEPVFTGDQWGTLRGLASGGVVPASAFGSSGSFSVAQIVALIRALATPLNELAHATTAVRKAQQVYDAEIRPVRGPLHRLTVAREHSKQATDERDNLRERVALLKRHADATKGVTAADRDYRRAVADLRDANLAVTRTSKEKTAAQQAYDKVAGRAKDASDRLRAAQQALAEQQKAVADAARQQSDTFRHAYESQTTDVTDWLALMKDGQADLAKFATLIDRLRKAGLSETLVQQILARGAVAGTDVASQILGGGKGLVSSLNKANQGIQNAADILGYKTVTGQGRYAAGGMVTGLGGPTSDSVSIKASPGEWVVPERSVGPNLGYLHAITYGRNPIERRYADSNYRYGGPVQPQIDLAALRATGGFAVNVEHWHGGDPQATARALDMRRRDAMAMAGLSGMAL